MVEQTKFVPSFWADCDDLVVRDDDGNEYHPHAGERVRFRADLPWLITLLRADMPNTEYVAGVLEVLKRQVLEWTWTGEDGEPLPQPDDPGFERVLMNLGSWERQWLLDNCWQAARNPNA